MAKKTKQTRMPRVLVTGANGFLGRHLVEGLLSIGFKVTCLVRNQPNGHELDECKIVIGDINDTTSLSDALKGAEVVIHAAAVINTADLGEYDKVNVEGTRKIVEESKKAKIKHFIFISSVDVDHGTRYGKSKMQGEELVKSSGLPYTILRPGPIYGAGDNKNIIGMYNLVATKKVIPVVGDGNALRQPIHVDDAVESIIKTIASPRAVGRTYYIGGPSITYNEILSAIIDASDYRPTIVHLPAGIAKTLVLAANKFGLGPEMNPDQVRTLDQDKVGDVQAFQKEFGVIPRGFKEGFTQPLIEMGIKKPGTTSESAKAAIAPKKRDAKESKAESAKKSTKKEAKPAHKKSIKHTVAKPKTVPKPTAKTQKIKKPSPKNKTIIKPTSKDISGSGTKTEKQSNQKIEKQPNQKSEQDTIKSDPFPEWETKNAIPGLSEDINPAPKEPNPNKLNPNKLNPNKPNTQEETK